MPAEVESMMYAGDVPWHGIGTPLPAEVCAEDCIKLSGLDWDVETAPIVTNDQKRTGVDDYRVTRRMTDDVILGVVKKNFTPIQNRAAFGLFDHVVGEGRVIYHTAGSLRGGSKVFIVAKLPGVITIGGKDDVERYLLLCNSHDGSIPLHMLFTPVRVVCSNTLSLALARARTIDDVDEEGEDSKAWDRNAPRVTIRQTRDAHKRLKEAERTMAKALAYYEKFGEFAEYVASRQLSVHQTTNIIAKVFPPNKKQEVTPTVAYHRGEVTRLFDEGKGHHNIAGSGWALLNAFAEYADHGYSLRGAKEAEDRSYSVLMGGAKGLKARAGRIIGRALEA